VLDIAGPAGAQNHPLRSIRRVADEAFKEMDAVLAGMYSRTGRPSIPPERLLKSFVLMALYSIRSERLFCEQLDYNLLFRWFLDMDMVEDSFDHSSFSKNRQRLLDHGVAQKFFAQVVGYARDKELLSDDHFTVDGTLIEAWASLKSFKPKAEKPNEIRNRPMIRAIPALISRAKSAKTAHTPPLLIPNPC
jgi:transposase